MKYGIVNLALLLSATLITAVVYGQTACPAGVAPGSPQCGPSPEYHGVGGNSNNIQSGQKPIIIKTMWVDRWGAVAIDGDVGSLGAVEGIKNKKQAEKFAIAECVKKGGRKCLLNLSYANQCIAMVNGANKYYLQLGSSINLAEEKSKNVCMSGDKDCRVYYSACSMAERIR